MSSLQGHFDPVAPSLTDEGADLFSRAAEPGISLSKLSEFILEQALQVAQVDMGAALLIRDPATNCQEIRIQPRGAPLSLSCGKTAAPREISDHPFFQAASQQVINRSFQSADPGMAFFPGSRSLVWIPIDISPALGLLQLEASSPPGKSSSLDRRLSELVRTAGVLLSRVLLRDHAARLGHSIYFIGRSQSALGLEQHLRLIAADSKSSVLVRGERGSGKELAAYAIHYFSQRRHGPFVPVNCAAFSDTLFADELFGHDRNAFTGAQAKRPGLFQAAEGGTIFLDEVGDLAPPIQAALLRVLDQGEFRHLGSDLAVKVDARVIGASNRDLEEMMERGSFRADLFDRLNIFEVKVPPLRERKEDIELLAGFYLKASCHQNGRHLRLKDPGLCEACLFAGKPGCVTSSLFQSLAAYNYPGNVRELRNIVLRMSAMNPDEHLAGAHARPYVLAKAAAASEESLGLDDCVRNHIRHVLDLTGQNKTQAARLLGLPLTTLVNKMKKLGLD